MYGKMSYFFFPTHLPLQFGLFSHNCFFPFCLCKYTYENWFVAPRKLHESEPWWEALQQAADKTAESTPGIPLWSMLQQPPVSKLKKIIELQELPTQHTGSNVFPTSHTKTSSHFLKTAVHSPAGLGNKTRRINSILWLHIRLLLN